MKKFTFSIALVLSFYVGLAQQHVCGTDDQYKIGAASDPQLAAQRTQFNRAFAEFMKTYNPDDYKTQPGIGKASAPKYIIPIVVHVFHQNGPENISEAQILNEIAQLNKSFRKLNSDTGNVRTIFKDIAADAKIEFRLAKKDPLGKCTNGIIRYYTPNTQKGNEDLKKRSVWDTKRYFNMWVVNTINRGPGISVAGYAQFPFATGGPVSSASTDGIMIVHDQFGNIGTATPNPGNPNNTVNQTTSSHEAGHWLGLYHPFQGDSCDNEGDGISETPTTYFMPTPQEPLRNVCGTPNFNSCATDNPDLPDQYENFMDYFEGPCASNMFTLQQVARMHFCLDNYRRQLWQPENLEKTGVVDGYTCNPLPIASFNSVTPGKAVCQGATIDFMDNSYNASVTSWLWDFGAGATPSTSTAKNPQNISYSSSGWKNVSLTVTGPSGTNKTTLENAVYVQPANEFMGYGDGFYNADWDYENDFLQKGWSIESEAEGTWTRTDKAKVNGNMSLMLATKTLSYGFTYSLISPTYNFSGAPNAYISYNYSFAANFTSPASTNDSRDIFELLVSNDCGKTWIARKTIKGQTHPDSLARANPLTTSGGPSQYSADYVPTNQFQWKKDGLSGTSICSGDKLSSVKFKLSFTYLGGNNFYLDALIVGIKSGLNTLTAKDIHFTIMPNPFTSSAMLSYELTAKQDVSIKLFDIVGHEVADLQNKTQDAGKHEVIINKEELGLRTGLYFIKTSVNGSFFTTKVLVN
jgi:PKD repeat protein